jgi:aspartyl-tRNA(Asn)/glutamyl-tRNA(Gln) amidotransferase subunit A
MNENELVFTPAWKQARMIAQKQVSPVEITELYLRRIERLNPHLNAYITVWADRAMAEARQAEARVMNGQDLPPLHGVTVSLKDLEATGGIRTTLGSLIFKDTVPQHDSVVAERVKRAGAIILGKTSTPEFGLGSRGATTENRLMDACKNPWDPEHTTGGSSGGAGAAQVAGLCALATGSDGGGSIRIPASFCGVFGFKPTNGRVPRAEGLGKPEPNQFSQSGPMTNYVRDAAILLQELSGPDSRDPSPYLREGPPDFLAALDGDIKELRIGWSPDMGFGTVDSEVGARVREAAYVFKDLGCHVEDADIGLDDHWEHFWNVFTANAYASYSDLLDERANDLTYYAREALEHGRSVTGAQYARSVRDAFELRLQMNEFMERYDLLLTPTTSVVAFKVADPPKTIAGREVNPFWGFYPYTFPINMAGLPAASIPCGFLDGLPLGLHAIGRRGEDGLVLRASARFEEARPWQDKHPPLS